MEVRFYYYQGGRENSRSLGQHTKNVGDLPCQLLSSEPNQVGAGYHGDVGQDEDDQVVVREGISDGDGSGDDGPQEIDRGRDFTRRPEGDAEEVKRVDAGTTALARRLDLEAFLGTCTLAAVRELALV